MPSQEDLMLQYKKIDSSNPAKNPIIQCHANRARCEFSTEFVVVENNVEVAFLCYENNPRHLSGFIYEIYVISEFRNHGLGNEILSFAESLAKKDQKSAVKLKPYALDRTIDVNILIEWYKRKGYSWATDDPCKMEKQID